MKEPIIANLEHITEEIMDLTEYYDKEEARMINLTGYDKADVLMNF